MLNKKRDKSSKRFFETFKIGVSKDPFEGTKPTQLKKIFEAVLLKPTITELPIT